MPFWLDWNIPKEDASFDENYRKVSFLQSWSFWYDEFGTFAWHYDGQNDNAEVENCSLYWDVAFWYNYFYDIFKINFEAGWECRAGSPLEGNVKSKAHQKMLYAFMLPVFRNSRFWAACFSNTACHISSPVQPHTPLVPLGDFLPARDISLSLLVWQVSPQVLLRSHSRCVFLSKELRERLKWQRNAQESWPWEKRRHVISEQSVFFWNYKKAWWGVWKRCCIASWDTGPMGMGGESAA